MDYVYILMMKSKDHLTNTWHYCNIAVYPNENQALDKANELQKITIDKDTFYMVEKNIWMGAN